MKNLKYIMATLMVALIVAVVCVACNKDKETPIQEANNNSDNEPNTEVVERKPIATMDTKTGKMTYYLTTDKLQEALSLSANIKNNDSYIFESFEIVSLNSKSEAEKGLRFSVLDTETEDSYLSFLNCEFLEKRTTNDSIIYFFSEDVENGNFTYIDIRNEEGVKYTLLNYQVIGTEIIPDSLMSYYSGPRPKVIVTCHSHGCRSGSCDVYCDIYGNPAGCIPCDKLFEDSYCDTETTVISGGGVDPGWLQLLWEVIRRFLK